MTYLLFFIVPIVEMYLLISIGGRIGALPTVALVMLTAVIGVFLLKRQGLATFARAQQRLQEGAVPAEEMLEGVGLALAGAFLLTPGFVTDAAGFLLLLPPLRQRMVRRLASRLVPVGSAERGPITPGSVSPGPEGDVIEGEFEKRP